MSESQTSTVTPAPPPPRPPHTYRRAILSIVIIFLVALGGFLIYVSTRPEDFSVTRTAVIPAAPERVFAIVNDFHKWEDWSPWAKLDPNSKTTFSGPTAGVGAEFTWNGNSEVGQGRMTITDSQPSELIKLDLEFIKPMPGQSVTEFTFQPEGEGTKVTWTMSGKNGFMGKLFSVLMDCDKMIGGYFEQGFENMKKLLLVKAEST